MWNRYTSAVSGFDPSKWRVEVEQMTSIMRGSDAFPFWVELSVISRCPRTRRPRSTRRRIRPQVQSQALSSRAAHVQSRCLLPRTKRITSTTMSTSQNPSAGPSSSLVGTRPRRRRSSDTGSGDAAPSEFVNGFGSFAVEASGWLVKDGDAHAHLIRVFGPRPRLAHVGPRPCLRAAAIRHNRCFGRNDDTYLVAVVLV